VAGRDDEAFKRLVGVTWPSLVRLGRLLVGDPYVAEDLAQTALLKTWEHWPRLRAPEAASAYARTTLVRDAARHREKRRREDRRELDDLPELDNPDPHLGTPTALLVRGALAGLPYDQRAALVLRYLLDLSEAETAEILGVAPGTVKSRCARASASLRASGVLTPAGGN
jgi:RNA polymerase sigma-70 factor (sigma-E family)